MSAGGLWGFFGYTTTVATYSLPAVIGIGVGVGLLGGAAIGGGVYGAYKLGQHSQREDVEEQDTPIPPFPQLSPQPSNERYHLFFIDGTFQATADCVYKEFSTAAEANAAFDSLNHSRALILESVELRRFKWFRVWLPWSRWHQDFLEAFVCRQLQQAPHSSLEAVLAQS